MPAIFPTGVIIDAAAVALGGLTGAMVGPHIKNDMKDGLNLIFGVSSMAMGIGSIVLMQNLPAVIFSIIIGTTVGLILQLGRRLEAVGGKLQKALDRGKEKSQDTAALVTAIVLFCASGTGIYGSIVSGMSGDHSILIAKAILDYFTAMIFACSQGIVISLIAIPQCVIFLLLFLLSGLILPMTNTAMINDFKACGGIIMLATGFRIGKIKSFPITEMLPAMLLVMTVSNLWMNYILPLL